MHRRLSVISAMAFAVAAAASAEAATYIHAGKLIDGVADAPLGPHTLVVDQGQIVRIVSGYAEPGDGDDAIDLKDHTVMPGLMDMHTHLHATDGGASSYLEPFTLSAADYVLKMEHNARITLEAGFTAVRDLGDAHDASVALRNAINKGLVVGPHIYTSTSPLASTGGHGDPTNGVSRELHLPAPGPAQGVIDSPDEARKAVRQRYKTGANLIKITATGGVMSLAASGDNAQFTPEELNAIVATAKDYGMKVAAHAHGLEGIRRAVEAGVASIEHGTYLDENVMRLMKRKGVYLVPTLMAGEWVSEQSKIEGALPPVVRRKAATIGPLMAATFSRAYKAGVPIMFGTDSGVSAHGENAHEFELMVAAGMPPMAAIKSATAVPAAYLGVSDNVGTLEQGKAADIIAVPGDPIANIAVMKDVSFVMIGGAIVKAAP